MPRTEWRRWNCTLKTHGIRIEKILSSSEVLTWSYTCAAETKSTIVETEDQQRQEILIGYVQGS